jgi:hypothetical protein
MCKLIDSNCGVVQVCVGKMRQPQQSANSLPIELQIQLVRLIIWSSRSQRIGITLHPLCHGTKISQPERFLRARFVLCLKNRELSLFFGEGKAKRKRKVNSTNYWTLQCILDPVKA